MSNDQLSDLFADYPAYASAPGYWELLEAASDLLSQTAHGSAHERSPEFRWVVQQLTTDRNLTAGEVSAVLEWAAATAGQDDREWTGSVLREPAATVYSRQLADTVDHMVGPCKPRSSAAGEIREAAAILDRLIPAVTKQTLPFAGRFFAVSEDRKELSSVSDAKLPGVVFLAEAAFSDRDFLAEAILHESLHQKLYALSESLHLNAERFQAGVCTPYWISSAQYNPGGWDPFTVLAAFHVYAHLTLLWCRGSADLSVESKRRQRRHQRALTCLVRARHLQGWLAAGVIGQLGEGTGPFFEWIGSSLDSVESDVTGDVACEGAAYAG